HVQLAEIVEVLQAHCVETRIESRDDARPHLPAAAIGAAHDPKVWQPPRVVLEDGRSFVGRAVVDDDPEGRLDRLRRHAVERAAKVLSLVAAGRDEEVASRGVHEDKLTDGPPSWRN